MKLRLGLINRVSVCSSLHVLNHAVLYGSFNKQSQTGLGITSIYFEMFMNNMWNIAEHMTVPYPMMYLTEDWNSGIHFDSFNRLKISSRISFLAQAFELLSVDRLQG